MPAFCLNTIHRNRRDSDSSTSRQQQHSLHKFLFVNSQIQNAPFRYLFHLSLDFSEVCADSVLSIANLSLQCKDGTLHTVMYHVCNAVRFEVIIIIYQDIVSHYAPRIFSSCYQHYMETEISGYVDHIVSLTSQQPIYYHFGGKASVLYNRNEDRCVARSCQ